MSEQRPLYGKTNPLAPLREAIAALEAAETAMYKLWRAFPSGRARYNIRDIYEQIGYALELLRDELELAETEALEAIRRELKG